jgi:hypothetical protein
LGDERREKIVARELLAAMLFSDSASSTSAWTLLGGDVM